MVFKICQRLMVTRCGGLEITFNFKRRTGEERRRMSQIEWVTHPHHLQLTAHHPLKAWSSLVPSVTMCLVFTQAPAAIKYVPKPNISQAFTIKEQTELRIQVKQTLGGHETLHKWARQWVFGKQRRASWDRFVSMLGMQLSSYYGWALQWTDCCH